MKTTVIARKTARCGLGGSVVVAASGVVTWCELGGEKYRLVTICSKYPKDYTHRRSQPCVTKSDLLDIDGIGESAASGLVEEGVTTREELERVLRELDPAAEKIYSTFQIDVLDELDLPTIGTQSVSQYTRQTLSDERIVYEWDREEDTHVLELTRESDAVRAKWYETDTADGEVHRNETYEKRADAKRALTRWAYRLPESA